MFATFLKLGVVSFGGPVAHLGYFHRELVGRRHWLDDAQYMRLVALCQFLPGPASSQLGFALGLLRAGWTGAIAAFVGFTLPSALVMYLFARLLPVLHHSLGAAAIHGLKLVAVAVVANALLGMVRQLAPDTPRRLIAVVAAAVVVVSGGALIQLLVVTLGAIAGVLFCRRSAVVPTDAELELPFGQRTGACLLVAFGALLAVALVPMAIATQPVATAAAFYRAGALVFGGGHVVLPLLEEAVVAPGWIDAGEFLAGYGVAQALPGPLFTFAAFLGARLDGGQGDPVGAVVGVLAIFLPGLLLVAGALPFWHALGRHPNAASAFAGVNAAVVGLLAAALYDPVWSSAVRAPADFAIASIAFVLLLVLPRASVLLAIAWCVLAATVSILLY